MSLTITGNVGGTAGSGAQVQLHNLNLSIKMLATCDTNGDYTFTVTDLNTYTLRATLAGFVIRQKYNVPINGISIAAVNFTISGINQANQ